MTVRRDLIALEEEGRLRRIHGGLSSEFARHEDSFWYRLEEEAAAKAGWPRSPSGFWRLATLCSWIVPPRPTTWRAGS